MSQFDTEIYLDPLLSKKNSGKYKRSKKINYKLLKISHLKKKNTKFREKNLN